MIDGLLMNQFFLHLKFDLFHFYSHFYAFISMLMISFSVMYTIDEHLEGNWMNIVQPLGRVALLLSVVSYIFLHLFNSWANVSFAHIILYTFDFLRQSAQIKHKNEELLTYFVGFSLFVPHETA